MDLKFNGSITKSWRSSLFGALSAVAFIAGAVAEVAGLHPSVRLWAFVVGALCGAATAALSADHVRLLVEVQKLAKAFAELQAQRQADAIKGRQSGAPAARAASVPDLDVPFSSEPIAPQDTQPDLPSPKEPR